MVTLELRTQVAALIADPTGIQRVAGNQVCALLAGIGDLIAELALLQAQLVGRLQALAPSSRWDEPETKPDRLLTPAETAAAMGMTVRWLYRHASQLPFTRRLSRRALRFSEAGLRAYMAGKAPRRGRP